MIIGERLRELREYKNLSQGDIEHRTGLLRCYISRVENGHTVPAVETLEKLSRALGVPLYQLLYDGEEAPTAPPNTRQNGSRKDEWGSFGRHARTLNKLRVFLSRMSEQERQLLMSFSKKLSKRKRVLTWQRRLGPTFPLGQVLSGVR